MTNCAAYIRVSTEEQKLHGISLDAQRDKLKTYAEAHDLKIVHWYEDEGVSGRKLIRKRPALQQMLLDAQAKKFELIIFIKLDRFFRSVAEYHECMKLIEPCKWIATEEKYDLTTANGRMFVNMKLTIAELEADQTGERIKIVNEYKAKTGQALTGSVPWGFKIEKVDGVKRVMVDESQRECAVDTINYFLRTQSLSRTLAYCKQWHSFYDLAGVRRWLTRTMLYGSYRGNDDYCEGIIDKDTFYAIQAKIKSNVKNTSVNKHPLFQRLLVCPHCGRKLCAATYSSPYKGKRYRYQSYRCDAYRFGRCDYRFVLFESKVERLLLDNLDKVLRDTVVQAEVQPLGSMKGEDKKAIQAELTRLNYMFEKDRITVEEYDKKYEAIQSRLSEADKPQDVDKEKIARLQSLVDSGWRDVYDQLDPQHRADFWHSILKEVLVQKDGRNYWIDRIDFL